MSLDLEKSIKSGDIRLTRSTFCRDARTPLPEHSRKRYFMITTSLPPDAVTSTRRECVICRIWVVHQVQLWPVANVSSRIFRIHIGL